MKDETTCMICDGIINEDTSPSSSSTIDPYNICDDCLDRLDTSSNDDDDDD